MRNYHPAILREATWTRAVMSGGRSSVERRRFCLARADQRRCPAWPLAERRIRTGPVGSIPSRDRRSPAPGVDRPRGDVVVELAGRGTPGAPAGSPFAGVSRTGPWASCAHGFVASRTGASPRHAGTPVASISVGQLCLQSPVHGFDSRLRLHFHRPAWH